MLKVEVFACVSSSSSERSAGLTLKNTLEAWVRQHPEAHILQCQQSESSGPNRGEHNLTLTIFYTEGK